MTSVLLAHVTCVLLLLGNQCTKNMLTSLQRYLIFPAAAAKKYLYLEAMTFCYKRCIVDKVVPQIVYHA